jgi:hypothetical protein
LCGCLTARLWSAVVGRVCFYINKIFFPGQLKNVLHICLIVNRPVKIEDENDNDNDFEISEESEENIIINLNKLSKMISAFLPHECQRASPSDC